MSDVEAPKSFVQKWTDVINRGGDPVKDHYESKSASTIARLEAENARLKNNEPPDGFISVYRHNEEIACLRDQRDAAQAENADSKAANVAFLSEANRQESELASLRAQVGELQAALAQSNARVTELEQAMETEDGMFPRTALAKSKGERL